MTNLQSFLSPRSLMPRCHSIAFKHVGIATYFRPQHFFSYTETDKGVSLILDETHLPGFPEDTLNVCNVIWRALQIEPGESGLGKMSCRLVVPEKKKGLYHLFVTCILNKLEMEISRRKE